jgi:hypothetical protein
VVEVVDFLIVVVLVEQQLTVAEMAQQVQQPQEATG